MQHDQRPRAFRDLPVRLYLVGDAEMSAVATAKTIAIVTARGSELHDILCDAFLDAAGYLLIDDSLFELLFANLVELESGTDAFSWRARRAVHAGRG
jgi:hypothetical protein